MAIANGKYDALIAKLEEEAKRHPRSYRTKVLLLSLLGYAYIFLVLLVLLSAIGLLIYVSFQMKLRATLIKLAIPLGALIVVILRSLWVHFERPGGVRLWRKGTPSLFGALDELRRSGKVSPIHEVVLTGEFNAAAASRPRFGVFGWSERYLLIGLPLMQALPPEQFLAVLAHELGHIAGAHDRLAGWTYRVRRTWQMLGEGLERAGNGSFLFERFFHLYAPYFIAYSFVLARDDEYCADSVSAEQAGSQHAADALVNICVKGYLLQEWFWPKVQREADNRPDPPVDLYERMGDELRREIGAEQAKIWIDRALFVTSGNSDTHPCLSDRLAALNMEASVPEAFTETAAQRFLGSALPALVAELSRNWQVQVDTEWRATYAQASTSRAKLAELEEKAGRQELSVDEAFERAILTEYYGRHNDAIPLYQEILRANPDHVGANLGLGRMLLSQYEDSGIAFVEKGMALDEEAIGPGLDIFYHYLVRRSRPEEAKKYLDQVIQRLRNVD